MTLLPLSTSAQNLIRFLRSTSAGTRREKGYYHAADRPGLSLYSAPADR